MFPIKPIPVDLGALNNSILDTYVHDWVRTIKDSCAVLHETKIKKWKSLTRGERNESKKNFPWPNASDLVIQIIGTCTDILKAAIMASIWDTLPIFRAELVGDWETNEEGDKQKDALEEAMNFYSMEQDELDLYRVESLWFGEAISLGTSFVKLPFEHLEEIQMVSLDGSSAPIEKSFVKKHGVTPVKIPFEHMGFDTKASTLEECRFKYHELHLSKEDLEERAYLGIYSKEAVDKILGNFDSPTKQGSQAEKEQKEGIAETNSPFNAEYYIYECWFPYFHNGKTFRLIYSYHFKTKTCLRKIYNFYPDNEEPIRMARLGYDDDGLLGFGYAEMLEHYQEETSTKHNQRNDAGTLANTSIARVSRASKLDSIFSLHPGAVVPGEQNEIEIMQLGRSAESTVPEEQLSLQLAERRAGIDMQITQGSGGGVTNPRKGVYSAMGTFSVMQQSNRRSNLRTTDMRYSHVSLGRLCSKLYSYFGLGQKSRIFGKNEPYLLKALEAIKSGKMSIPIRGATASINIELEKQNDILLINILRQHHMGNAQLIQSVLSGQIPPPLAKYLIATLRANDKIMSSVLRHFKHDDVNLLVPDNDLSKALSEWENHQESEEDKKRRSYVNGAGENSSGNGTGETSGGSSIYNSNSTTAIPGAAGTVDKSLPTSGMESVPILS